MKLIVGLGNPSEEHQNARHNLGFMVLDELLRKITPMEKTVWRQEKRFNSLAAKIGDSLLAKPQTFMNNSGFAVAKAVSYYHIEPTEIWVIHDDVDLPLRKMKIRLGGAAAGHRGVESIIEQLGTDEFIRFRLGIGHPKKGVDFEKKVVEDYVLAEFTSKERSEAKQMVKKCVEAIQFALDKSLAKAMNRFN